MTDITDIVADLRKAQDEDEIRLREAAEQIDELKERATAAEARLREAVEVLRQVLQQAEGMAYERHAQDWEEQGPPQYIVEARAFLLEDKP